MYLFKQAKKPVTEGKKIEKASKEQGITCRLISKIAYESKWLANMCKMEYVCYISRAVFRKLSRGCEVMR